METIGGLFHKKINKKNLDSGVILGDNPNFEGNFSLRGGSVLETTRLLGIFFLDFILFFFYIVLFIVLYIYYISHLIYILIILFSL